MKWTEYFNNRKTLLIFRNEDPRQLVRIGAAVQFTLDWLVGICCQNLRILVTMKNVGTDVLIDFL